MELKPGYKQTEVGVIPEDWDLYSGEQVTSLIGKGSSPRWQGFAYTTDGMLFVTSENVRDGHLDVRQPKYLPLSFHDKLKRTRLKKLDILINLVGSSIGRSCQVKFDPGEANVNQAVAVFRVTDSYCSGFIAFYLQSQEAVKRILDMQVDAARPNISLSDLRRFQIPVPPRREQVSIAGLLESASLLESSIECLIAKKLQIRQAAMQELLTGKRRLPGFEGEWEVKKLGSEIRDLQAGVSVTSTTDNDQTNTDHFVLKTSAVVQGRFIPSEKKEISPGEVKRAKTSIRKGDLIISRMNTPALVGECGYSDSDHPNLYLPDRLWRAAYSDPSAISSHWLSYALSMQQNRIRIKELATGTSGSMKNISKRALLDLEIKWPRLEEQVAIAEVLSEMDNDIDSINQQLLKAQAVKQGMMQQLLTGKIRLT